MWIMDTKRRINSRLGRPIVLRCFGHALSSQSEAAYARAEMIEKRREQMEHWAAYCSQTLGKVVQFPAERKKT